MRLRVIDIETTGMSPGDSEIVEFGRVDVVGADDDWVIETGYSRLYHPRKGIPPAALAVHHITEAMIGPDRPVCTTDRLEEAVWNTISPDVLVAHNAAFEMSFISALITRKLAWICTYKVALRLLPEAVGHSNQILRYILNLQLDEDRAMPPHRALPDAYVTAHLLAHLLSLASVDDMLQWSAEPRCYPKVPRGKYIGQKWSEVDNRYLHWMSTSPTMEADVVWCARQEHERRQRVQATKTASMQSGSRFGNRPGGVMREVSERLG